MFFFHFNFTSLIHKIILFTKFLLLLIDDLWCRTLGCSNFIQEDWHGRSTGEERSLRLIKLISHPWHGWEFLNPISLVLGQGKGSVTGSLASVNRSFSLNWFIRKTYFLLLTWKHAEKWIWFWISYLIHLISVPVPIFVSDNWNRCIFWFQFYFTTM